MAQREAEYHQPSRLHRRQVALAMQPSAGGVHSHSIVNSWSRLRGKASCVTAANGLDTDRSTVAFWSPSRGSSLSDSFVDGSPQRLECESGMFCGAMTVSDALTGGRRRYCMGG